MEQSNNSKAVINTTNVYYQPDHWRSDGSPEFAGIIVDGKFTSVGARLAIYSPGEVKDGQYSHAIVSVSSGEGTSLYNQIQAGWTVNPGHLKDSNIHFFYSITGSKIYNGHACVDTDCSDFTPTVRYLRSGDILTPSKVGSGVQNYLDVYIAQNKTSGEWYVNANSQRVATWSLATFSSLRSGATRIRVGGEVGTPSGWAASPPMGSGIFKPGMRSLTAYAEHVKIDSDESGEGGYEPQNPQVIESRCYFVADVGKHGTPVWFEGFGFYYGGKGGRDVDICIYHPHL